MFIKGGCRTDIGLRRKNNQDAIMFKKFEKDGNTFAMGVICDGIGGLEHGEVASRVVSKSAEAWFGKVTEWIDINNMEKEILFAHFKDAVDEWNATVRDLITSHHISTGTTLSAIIILGNCYFIIHVGDSRIYKYNNELMLITNDESTAKVTNNGMKFYLDNYVGKNDELSFKTYQGEVRHGDMYIFCSDGFYHTMSDNDIEYVYNHINNNSIEHLCESVINKRMEYGETDNISVGCIYCE